MSIVAQNDSQSQLVAQHSTKGHNAFPRQVGGILYATRNTGSTRTTYSYGTDGSVAAIFLSNVENSLCKAFHKFVNILIVGGGKMITIYYIAANVDNGISGASIANVYTDNALLNTCLLHSC